MNIRRIDHLAIAVPDVDAALVFFRDALGLKVGHTDIEPGQGVRVTCMPVGDGLVELIQPMEPESGVARFLERHGPGMHHLCLEVDDLDAALARLRSHGVQLIDDEPYVNQEGRRLVFIHPKSASGVLVELYEVRPPD